MKRIHEIPFRPLPFLTSGKWHTILASYGFPLKDPPTEEIIFELAGGDKICCSLSIPPNWKREKGIVVLMHGLGGSNGSHYMRRISKLLYEEEFLVACINRRGCGRGARLAKRLAHGGLTEDTLIMLQQIKKFYPDTKLQAVGFSMGGNILLKLLGELGGEAGDLIVRGIAVCPVVDFFDTCDHMCSPSMALFNDYYVKALVSLVNETSKAFPEVTPIVFPKKMTIEDYDRLYTVPAWGFKSLDEYYQTSGSNQWVPKIKIPCDILFSGDDPVIRSHTIEVLETPKKVTLWKTRYGGHLGFLGLGEHSGLRWMDHKLLSWLKES